MTEPATSSAGPPVRRRALLGGLLAVAGCGLPADVVPGRPTAASPTPSTTPEPAPEPVERPRPALLADPPGYVLPPGEVEPACKEAAVAFVVAALTHGATAARETPLARRTVALDRSLSVALPLLDLVPLGGASALEAVYPPYVGLAGDTASVMLVAEQLLVAGPRDPSVRRRSLTLDVRLFRAGGRWPIGEVRPAAEPVAVAEPSAAAEALIADERVVLPAAAHLPVARADAGRHGRHDRGRRAGDGGPARPRHRPPPGPRAPGLRRGLIRLVARRTHAG